MHLTKEDIQNTERIKRLNIINSITGIKPANLIGTISNDGKTNLAIFSSVIHLGSNPALIGFILRPDREAGQHTFDNIKENGSYTINHIHESFIEQAHYTSAKFTREESEFDKCALTEEFIADHKAPFVKESMLKLGMKIVQTIPIELNGTVLIIGEVEHLIIPDASMDDQGQIDLSQPNDVGISGLNTYYKLEKIAHFPYARPNALPDFPKDV
ncbi:flavin reductase family protein [Dyadobacter subterraneus]|uniref:Flavin reductase family protein n=1 Tax=Dyadobacter subterraneus TaxID=2773304 RepID=A0ABR9WPV4_9BACT|nr:flavin reductase family protein [Dyadobacter subterraneus]MBE9466401.1 flavin reductase family protein [Dyadobacter subterraneus]